MTIDELIERLEEVKEAGFLSGDTEVKVAHQPNYPLAAPLEMVTDPHEVIDPEDLETVERAQLDVLWLACGPSSEYAPRHAWGERDEQY